MLYNVYPIWYSITALCGSLAQLGEHLPYKQRVIGSSPIVSTICGSGSVVERRLAKANVASPNLVSRSTKWHLGQVVRQSSAKALFSSPNLEGASNKKKNACAELAE